MEEWVWYFNSQLLFPGRTWCLLAMGAKKPSYATAHWHTYTHTHTALRRPFTIPGSWSNTISVFFLIPVPRPVSSLPPPNKIPSLAFLKKSVPQSICDRLFMNISYTRGLKGSTLARLRALWERKEPTEMNSDTRLPSPSREEKRQNKSGEQGGSHTFSGTLLGRSVPCSKELHCGHSIGYTQQTRYNRNTTYGNQRSMRKSSSHAQSMLFCCFHPVTKHLGPQQGLTLADRLQTELQVLVFAETRWKLRLNSDPSVDRLPSSCSTTYLISVRQLNCAISLHAITEHVTALITQCLKSMTKSHHPVIPKTATFSSDLYASPTVRIISQYSRLPL